MRALAFGLVSLGTLLCAAFSCGQSESDGAAGGPADSATAGSGPSVAGTSGTAAGSATAGSATSGTSGTVAGGSAASGAPSGGSASGGQPDAQAGAGSEGGSASGLVDCDPKKIVCKRAAPECDAGEVPRVEGSCYGDCVKVEQCACGSADQCPQPNEYTCWAKQHCGPFVE
jgi:hypothetical protein